MIRKILIFALSAFVATDSYSQIRFHDEASDTARINNMLGDVRLQSLHGGKAVVAFGDMLLGVPYVGHTLEGKEEVLTVNLDELDCTTFAETLIALALTVDEGRSSWRDFVYNLQRIRYRNGVIKGYPSRLHYIADWAVDNIHRGNFKDVTTMFDRNAYITRTLDFMSENAAKYEALADSANLAGIKNVEIGYRSYRFPYIKTSDLSNKNIKSEFRDGDILAFVSNLKNLDVTHMGIVKMQSGEPYVMHASSSAGKVAVSAVPLPEFMKKNRQFLGVRVFRLN